MNFEELAKKFEVSEDEFKDMISYVFSNNLSALAFFEGYGSEYLLEKHIKTIPEITGHYKPGDNNLEVKGDVVVTYKDVPVSIEAKNVRRGTNSRKRKPKHIVNLEESYWTGYFSTRRPRSKLVTFSDGSQVDTYNSLRGQYDIIAVNVFQLIGKQQFVYCLETHLPSTEYIQAYTDLSPLQCQETLRGEILVRWPPVAPWTDSLQDVLEQALAHKQAPSSV